MRHPEDDLSCQINTWNMAQQPNCFAFHVPNGKKRNVVTATILKRMGVKAGVLDWVVLMPGGKCGLVELKVDTGLTAAQEGVMRILDDLGFPHAVCRSLDEWKEILRGWGVTWRGMK